MIIGEPITKKQTERLNPTTPVGLFYWEKIRKIYDEQNTTKLTKAFILHALGVQYRLKRDEALRILFFLRKKGYVDFNQRNADVELVVQTGGKK